MASSKKVKKKEITESSLNKTRPFVASKSDRIMDYLLKLDNKFTIVTLRVDGNKCVDDLGKRSASVPTLAPQNKLPSFGAQ